MKPLHCPLILPLVALLTLTVPGSADPIGPIEVTSKEEVWTTSSPAACGTEVTVEQAMVAGADSNPILMRVQTVISFDAVWDTSLDEVKKEHAELGNMCGAGYEVAYNDHGLLSIDYWWESLGAYPSTAAAHRVVDIQTGNVVTAEDCFTDEGLLAITNMLTSRVDLDVASQRKIVAEDADAEALEWYDSLIGERAITVDTLNSLGIEEEGIRIFYEIGFPHAIQAYEPCYSYLFTPDDLESYIAQDGPLNEWWATRERDIGC